MIDIYRDVPGIALKPIGRVNNRVNAPMRDGWDEVTSDIVLDPNLAEATGGLKEFSHIIVVFWMHQVSPWANEPLKVHPRGRLDLPQVGLFASRAPSRPNPIGLTVVPLLACRGNTLSVKGLDAINGTPVLDIKPYLPRDLVPDAGWPAWVGEL